MNREQRKLFRETKRMLREITAILYSGWPKVEMTDEDYAMKERREKQER